MSIIFDAQGHRGARGLRPENTLPSFELALDLGVTAIETDLHLTRDDVPVLCHDPSVTERLCRVLPGMEGPDLRTRPLLRSLRLSELRSIVADRNPDPQRFPNQEATVTPLVHSLSSAWRIDPYTIPTLAEFIDFVAAYHGEQGRAAGKTDEQRNRARRLGFDLELKRVPFQPETMGDNFDGLHPSVLEKKVVEVVQAAGVTGRTTVRSFDHRCVRAIRRLEPRITTAVLIAGTAPIDPPALVRNAESQIYCPEYTFLDEQQVHQCQAAGFRVIPWTVNDVIDMQRLLGWQVDGMTTDFPDRLNDLLRMMGQGN
jgi:glycerophosphoryl diester phosphodiesterase